MAAAARPKFVIGIDEVGRGPLAGPVVVAAVAVPAKLALAFAAHGAALHDSKRLTAKAREEWAAFVHAHPEMRQVIVQAGPRAIDRLNVSRAANLAARRACLRLARACGAALDECAVYLDGGLFLGNGRSRLPAKTLPKGDELIPAVALASIVAKVHRDRLMVRAAARFPGYGFEVHKGYGTRRHLAAMRALGPSALHRLTFQAK